MAKGKGELPKAAGGNGGKWVFIPVGNEQIKTENYEEHLYDRKDNPHLMTPLHVPRNTLNDHTTSSKHGKKCWRGLCPFNQLPGADKAQAQEEREENADRHID